MNCHFIAPLCAFFIFFLSFFTGASLQAFDVYYGSSAQKVTLVYGESTIFRFDEPVKTLSNASRFIIEPADETSPDYTVLKVKPRYKKSKDEINFILANGAVVRVKAVTVSKRIPEKTHAVYDFQPKSGEIRQVAQEHSITELDLLKAMIKDEHVSGYKKRSLRRIVHSGDRYLKIRLVKLYSGQKFNGYVFRIENLSKSKDYEINLEHLGLGHPSTALISQVDVNRLKRKGNVGSVSYLRVVAKATANYYNLNLPYKEYSKEPDS